MTATRPLFLYLRAFHSIVPSPVPSFVLIFLVSFIPSRHPFRWQAGIVPIANERSE